MTKRKASDDIIDEQPFDYRDIPALAAYIQRVSAEQLNFRRFIIKEYKAHYYNERAVIKINSEGEITCSHKEYAPTKEEFEAIRGALMSAAFPRAVEFDTLDPLIKKIGGSRVLYSFYNRKTGKIIMAQERLKLPSGQKAYPPWTFWSDGVWRRMEPEGKLPFWKPKQRRSARIMIHEGAKVAQFVDELLHDPQRKKELASHPWAEEFALYEHWGLIGGAMAPHRADYDEIKREMPIEVVYFCDNDWPGQAAMQDVSKSYGRAMKGVRVDNRWPGSWDCADDMPVSMFRGRRWIGPAFKDLLVPATRATEVVPSPEGRGKGTTLLRRDFREEWFHCVTPEVFVHTTWPDRILNAQEFNNKVAPFSDVANTAGLMMKDDAAKGAVLKYSPALASGIYGSGDSGRFINTHVPSSIKAEKGDVGNWNEYLQHLVPGVEDRVELERWIYTLIAKPEVKMLYGMLLISETQGVGKSTLGEKVLAPLLGENNVSTPSENEIVESNYNYWSAHKRLAVVHEIYAGHSSKAYNRLKSVITDKVITVSKKYQANYDVENWVHVFACSNSPRAIHLPNDDRRWFVPKVAEVKRSQKYWDSFNLWLTEEGGLGIIKWYAGEWIVKNGGVQKGDPAPDSLLKREIVEESYSAGQALVARTLDRVKELVEGEDEALKSDWTQKGWLLDGGVVVLDSALVDLVRNQVYNGQNNDRLERPATLRKIAKGHGWWVLETRVKVKEWMAGAPGSVVVKALSNNKSLAEKTPGELAKAGVKPIDLSQVVGL